MLLFIAILLLKFKIDTICHIYFTPSIFIRQERFFAFIDDKSFGVLTDGMPALIQEPAFRLEYGVLDLPPMRH